MSFYCHYPIPFSNSPWQKHTPIINYTFVIELDISETKSSYFAFLQECLSNPWPFIYVFFMFINECTLLVLGIYCYKTNYSISGWKQHKHYLTVFVGQEPRSRLAGWGPLAQRLSWPTCGQEIDSHPKT